MKIVNLALLGTLLLLTACSGETQFPEPTGKGTFRALNAISTSPEMVFRLEESGTETIAYRSASPSRRFDDFEYTFNFEVNFPGELQIRRVASVTTKIEANKDFTFVATGAVENPTILTWVADERTFEADATIAEIRFAHLAESEDSVDIYLAPAGTPPALGEARGTLAYGEILPPIDVDSGSYVLTVTAAGDPATVIFQSGTANYLPQTALILAIFDATADETAPVITRGLATAGGSSFTLTDTRFPSTIQFVQASRTLDAVDIYDDAALTNPVATALPYKGVTAPIDIVNSETTYSFTPAGSTGAVLLESVVTPIGGTRYDHYSLGQADVLGSIWGPRDTQPVEIYPTLSLTNALVNEQVVDVYVVAPGTDIENRPPRFTALYGFLSGRLPLEAGTYEIIVTADDSKTPLASIEVTLAAGDVARYAAFETADPNVIELLPVP